MLYIDDIKTVMTSDNYEGKVVFIKVWKWKKEVLMSVDEVVFEEILCHFPILNK